MPSKSDQNKLASVLLVSVVPPVYNTWVCSRHAIGGVFSQSFSDFKLIIIDEELAGASGAVAQADKKFSGSASFWLSRLGS